MGGGIKLTVVGSEDTTIRETRKAISNEPSAVKKMLACNGGCLCGGGCYFVATISIIRTVPVRCSISTIHVIYIGILLKIAFNGTSCKPTTISNVSHSALYYFCFFLSVLIL